MTTARPESIWTATFALLCLAQFLGYAHNAMLTPTFPLYVTHFGGSPFIVGLVLAAFSVTSVLFRPFIGYWSDRWSEAGVLAAGSLFLGASTFLCFIPAAGATMIANGLRGIGWAGLNTGGYSLLALTAPLARRGEASGYYSGAQSASTVFFPAVALWLIKAPLGGFGVVIFVSTALAIVGGAIGVVLARRASTAARGEPSHPSHRPGKARFRAFALLDRGVLLASTLLFCLNIPHPAVTSFLVLYTQEIGIGHIEWYFVVSGLTSLLARPALGRISDNIGCGRSLAVAFVFETLAVLTLVAASGLTLVLVSGTLYALGAGLGTATTLALAMRHANPQHLGRAMATFSIAFPLSVGVGALLSGSAVEVAGYTGMFFVVAAVAAGGFLLTLANWPNLE